MISNLTGGGLAKFPIRGNFHVQSLSNVQEYEYVFLVTLWALLCDCSRMLGWRETRLEKVIMAQTIYEMLDTVRRNLDSVL